MVHRHTGLFFTLPAVVLLAGVLGIPLAAAVLLSVTTRSGIGFDHYVRLFQDGSARHSFWVTFVFTVSSVTMHLLLGMVAALLLKSKLWLGRLWRILLLVPWIISPVICGVIWRWMLDPLYGMINGWLLRLGLVAQPVLWLEHPIWALVSVTAAWVWTGFPFVMLIILAGLQQIPEELYEAARVDGASGPQRFRYVTLPGLQLVLGVAVLLDTIQGFRAFSSIYVMTQGGPGDTTNIISIFIFKYAFEYFDFEFASAVGVAMAAILLAFGYLYMRSVGEEVA